MKSVCIVIPIHKTAPSGNELCSISHCMEIFNGSDIAYIAPMGCHKPWQLKYYKLWHSMGVPKYKD